VFTVVVLIVELVEVPIVYQLTLTQITKHTRELLGLKCGEPAVKASFALLIMLCPRGRRLSGVGTAISGYRLAARPLGMKPFVVAKLYMSKECSSDMFCIVVSKF
jgi:hypothetical protein